MNKRSVKHIIGLGVAATLLIGSAFISNPSNMIYVLVLGVGVLMWSEYQYGER